MDERHEALARRFKEGLEAIYGPRLRGLYACQDDDEGIEGISTVVVLDDIKSYSREIDSTGVLASDLIIDSGMALVFRLATEKELRERRGLVPAALRPVA